MWWSALAFADDVVPSAALTATGGAGAAAPRENAAITLNPGMLGLVERYDLQINGGYGVDAGAHWGVSLVDGRTSDVVSGGFSYSGSNLEPPIRTDELPGWRTPGTEIPNQKRYHDFALGLARPLADRRLSLGLGADLGYFQHDRQGSGWTFDLDAGLGWSPARDLYVGLAGRNLLPLAGEDRGAQALGGLRLAPRGAALAVDAAWVSDAPSGALPLGLAAGGEVQLDALALRAGWRRDALASAVGGAGTQSVTAGFGLAGGSGSFEAALAVPVSGRVTADRLTVSASVRVLGGSDIEAPRSP